MKKKFYLTTSIAYTNAPPHLGFALEVVQADVLARYQRMMGREVFFLTGTDEHGQKVARAAREEGKNPRSFCNQISAQFKALKKVLNLSNDDFIRTTDQKRHWPAVKKVWLILKKKGDLYKRKYRGLYCSGCEAFLTKKDLKAGKCAIHQLKPWPIEEENYFFRLSKYSKKIAQLLEKDQIRIVPSTRKNEILNFVKQGLEDISFSRPRSDLKWGIPVPDDPSQTIYVWADALVNYISALGYAQDGKKFKKFWPADVHCIGKDILKFHAAIWPGILLALNLPLPKLIFVHGFITVEGKKMSKTLGNIIDPFFLVKKYGTDPVRYFLLREIPPSEDGDFSYQKFEARYNSDLAYGLGNLVARIAALAVNLKFKNLKLKISDQNLKLNLDRTWGKYRKAIENFKFNQALASIWKMIGCCDKYLEKEKPWQKKERAPEIVLNLLLVLSHLSWMLWPFLPQSSERIFNQLGIKPISKKPWQFKVKIKKPLFPKI